MEGQAARREAASSKLGDHPVLQRIGHVRRVQAGTVLVTAPCDVAEVLIVRSGTVHLTVRHHGGGRQAVEVCCGDAVIGDEALLAGRPMTFDVVAETAATVLAIPASALLRALGECPGLAQRWLTSLAVRSQRTRRRLRWLQTHRLTGQIAAVLLDECTPRADGTWTVELSHDTIAGLLGARRQSVSRVFAELREAGLVSNGYRSVVVHDRAALEALIR